MRKRPTGLKRLKANYKRKATIGATTCIYMALFGEKPTRARTKK